MITKLPIRQARQGFVRWLFFSAVWSLTLLVIAQFRLVWLWVGVGSLLGFLTDCALDIFASRLHQRELRKEYRRRFEAGESEAEEPRP